VSGSVRAEGREVVLRLGVMVDGEEMATAMDADGAEEMAHALLLCAYAARGNGVTDRDEAVVKGMVLR